MQGRGIRFAQNGVRFLQIFTRAGYDQHVPAGFQVIFVLLEVISQGRADVNRRSLCEKRTILATPSHRVGTSAEIVDSPRFT
jgi:hypothetical protein